MQYSKAALTKFLTHFKELFHDWQGFEEPVLGEAQPHALVSMNYAACSSALMPAAEPCTCKMTCAAQPEPMLYSPLPTCLSCATWLALPICYKVQGFLTLFCNTSIAYTNPFSRIQLILCPYRGQALCMAY